jgi:hypothetical protein
MKIEHLLGNYEVEYLEDPQEDVEGTFSLEKKEDGFWFEFKLVHTTNYGYEALFFEGEKYILAAQNLRLFPSRTSTKSWEAVYREKVDEQGTNRLVELEFVEEEGGLALLYSKDYRFYKSEA